MGTSCRCSCPQWLSLACGSQDRHPASDQSHVLLISSCGSEKSFRSVAAQYQNCPLMRKALPSTTTVLPHTLYHLRPPFPLRLVFLSTCKPLSSPYFIPTHGTAYPLWAFAFWKICGCFWKARSLWTVLCLSSATQFPSKLKS